MKTHGLLCAKVVTLSPSPGECRRKGFEGYIIESDIYGSQDYHITLCSKIWDMKEHGALCHPGLYSTMFIMDLLENLECFQDDTTSIGKAVLCLWQGIGVTRITQYRLEYSACNPAFTLNAFLVNDILFLKGNYESIDMIQHADKYNQVWQVEQALKLWWLVPSLAYRVLLTESIDIQKLVLSIV